MSSSSDSEIEMEELKEGTTFEVKQDKEDKKEQPIETPKEQPKEEKKKEDPRRKTALENLRKGREKYQAMKKLGIAPKKGQGKKAQQKLNVIEETDSSTSSSSSSDEEYTLKKKNKGKKKQIKRTDNNSNYVTKQDLDEMKQMILLMAKSKKHKHKDKPKKQTVINIQQPKENKVKDNDNALQEAIRKRMFGI